MTTFRELVEALVVWQYYHQRTTSSNQPNLPDALGVLFIIPSACAGLQDDLPPAKRCIALLFIIPTRSCARQLQAIQPAPLASIGINPPRATTTESTSHASPALLSHFPEPSNPYIPTTSHPPIRWSDKRQARLQDRMRGILHPSAVCSWANTRRASGNAVRCWISGIGWFFEVVGRRREGINSV